MELQLASELLKEGKSVVLQVKGTSMYPELFTGDKVTLTPFTSLKENDVVFARSGGKFIIHRYLGKRENYHITKGDNAFTEDPPAEEIFGVVKEKKLSLYSKILRWKYYLFARLGVGRLLRRIKFKRIQEEEYHGPLHDLENIYYQPSQEKNLNIIFSELNIKASDIFCDVGCGKGDVLEFAKKYSFKNIYGIEIDTSLFSFAENRFSQNSSTISLVYGDAGTWEIPSEITHFFLFNPIRGNVLKSFLENLNGLEGPKTLIYHGNYQTEFDFLIENGWRLTQGSLPSVFILNR